MSLIPAFHAGIWNAWILMLIFPLHPLLLISIDKAIGTGEIFKKMGEAPTGKEEKRTNTIYMVVLFLLLAYSVFLPMKTGTAWFYVGLTVYLLALVVLVFAIFTAAITPAGRIFTRGIYRYSRHPMYLSLLIISFAAGVASASWIFLLLCMVLTAVQMTIVKAEEQTCIKNFGDEYLEYMRKIPKWIGFPKPD